MKDMKITLIIIVSIFTVIILVNCSKTVESDNELPEVTIFNPEDGETITEPIIIQAEATDNEGIDNVEFFIDSLLICTDEELPYEAYFNPFYYSDGNNHSIIVKATDINENVSIPIEIQITIPEGLENFPELIQPQNNEFFLYGTEIQFIWHSFLDASSYNFQLSNDLNFNSIIHEVSLFDTMYSFTPEENEQLFWRIRAIDELENPSNWSITRSLFCDEIILFNKIYDPMETSRIRKVLQLEDGNFAILGTVTLTTLETYTVFMIVDKFGNQLSSRIYDENTWVVSNDMVHTNDGCFILAGYLSQENNRYPRNMMIVKINENCDIIWEKMYEDDFPNKVEKIIQTSDGGFAMVGTQNGSNFYQHTRVIKADEYGDQQWEYLSTVGVKNGFDLIQSDTGELIIVSNHEINPDSYYRNLNVKKLDLNGEVIWSSYFFPLTDGYISSGVIAKANNGYIIAGKDGLVLYQVAITDNGELIWNQEYDFNAYEDICSINPTSDNNFILSGWTDIGWGVDERLLLIKTDQLGNTLWYKEHQLNDNRSMGFSAEQCFDDNFIIGGQTLIYGFKMWLLKTDENGNIYTE
jgi:hypothetical protein